MSNMEDLIKCIREHKKKFAITENSTIAEQLRYRANNIKTDLEWLQLEKDIQEYMSTNPSDDEKKILFSFGEMVGMRCSAINPRAARED